MDLMLVFTKSNLCSAASPLCFLLKVPAVTFKQLPHRHFYCTGIAEKLTSRSTCSINSGDPQKTRARITFPSGRYAFKTVSRPTKNSFQKLLNAPPEASRDQACVFPHELQSKQCTNTMSVGEGPPHHKAPTEWSVPDAHGAASCPRRRRSAFESFILLVISSLIRSSSQATV